MAEVPPNPQLIVPGGKLLYNSNRDARHPYMYVVENHQLDQRVVPFKGRVIVFIQDTLDEAIFSIEEFEDEMELPFGLKLRYGTIPRYK